MGSHLIVVLLLCLSLVITLLVVHVERKRRMTLMNLLHRVIGSNHRRPQSQEVHDAPDDLGEH